MSAIIPFDFGSVAAPAARRRDRRINLDVMTHAQGYPSISIKGKVFAVVKGDERTPLMRDLDGDQVPVASIRLAVVRANVRSRVFYAKGYVEGDSDGAKPTCFSHDGQHPDAQVENPQATNCQLCPHAQWGSKVSSDGNTKGTACAPNTRLAAVVPDSLLSGERPDIYLLRVPPGSRANFSTAVSQADKAGKDYNEIVMKVGFDPQAPSPKLTFTPVGMLSDEAFAKVEELFEDDGVLDIIGRPSVPLAERAAPPALAAPPARAPALTHDDLDSGAPPAPAPRPAPRPAPTPALAAEDLDDAPPPAPRAPAKAKAKATPAPAAPASSDALLAGLGSMLGLSDD